MWEVKVVTENTIDGLVDRVNEEGKTGWELVNVVIENKPSGALAHAFLKRRQ